MLGDLASWPCQDRASGGACEFFITLVSYAGRYVPRERFRRNGPLGYASGRHLRPKTAEEDHASLEMTHRERRTGRDRRAPTPSTARSGSEQGLGRLHSTWHVSAVPHRSPSSQDSLSVSSGGISRATAYLPTHVMPSRSRSPSATHLHPTHD